MPAYLFAAAVALADLLLVAYLVRSWSLRSGRATEPQAVCSKCLNSGVGTREATYVMEGDWMCDAHYNEALFQHEKMTEEARRQHRDAILDGSDWSRRLLSRQQRLASDRRGPRR